MILVNILLAREPTFEPKPDQPRRCVFFYITDQADVQAAEEAFLITNAPDEELNDRQRKLSKEYRRYPLRSLSVGDAVKVGHRLFLCQHNGWEDITHCHTPPVAC